MWLYLETGPIKWVVEVKRSRKSEALTSIGLVSFSDEKERDHFLSLSPSLYMAAEERPSRNTVSSQSSASQEARPQETHPGDALGLDLPPEQ